MTARPIPGPWRILPQSRPRHVDTATTVDEVTWTAHCDRGPHDATWVKAKAAAGPTCMCPCRPEDGVEVPPFGGSVAAALRR